MICFSPLPMPVSPDIKRFSIKKEDSPEGRMRVLISGANTHKVTTPKAYKIAAIDMEYQFPGQQIQVEEVVDETGRSYHPLAPERDLIGNQTVIFVETPYELYQPFMDHAHTVEHRLREAYQQRRESLVAANGHLPENGIVYQSQIGLDHQIVPLPTADVFPTPEAVRATGD